MTMDFSRLHTYTPPQCAPENTGYTYSLSSSYSTVALEFEKVHQIAPVFNSPRMSRRSLRLQTTGGLYGNDSLADFSSQNHSSGGSSRTESWMVRSRKQQQSASSSQSLNQSLSLNQTPRKTLSFSTTNTPSTGCTTASDASLLSSILDQSSLRQRSTTTTTTDGYWGRSSRTDHSSTGANGGVNTGPHSHGMVANGYISKDCSIHSERKEALTTYSSSSSSQAASAAAAAAAFSSSSSQAASAAAAAAAISSSTSASSSSLYCMVKSQRSKTGLLVSVSNTCVHYSRRALAPIVSLVTLLFQNILWLGTRARSHSGKDIRDAYYWGLFRGAQLYKMFM